MFVAQALRPLIALGLVAEADTSVRETRPAEALAAPAQSKSKIEIWLKLDSRLSGGLVLDDERFGRKTLNPTFVFTVK